MSKASSTRNAPRTAAVAAIVLASLALAGCGSSSSSAVAVAPASTSATSGPGTAYPGGDGPLLPYADLFSVINAPLMDKSAHFTGETAKLDDPRYTMAVFYDKPGGNAIGALPGDLPVPVVDHVVAPAPEGAGAPNGQAPAGEWLRVMLPSRVALPSEASADLRPHLNEGTAWIWAKDVVVTNPKTHIVVDKSSRTVTVSAVDGTPNADGKVSVTFPAEIGADVPDGPTFMAAHYRSESTCGGGPMLPLSAQATNADGVAGQTVNPTAFMGPGEDCFKPGANDLTPVLPRVIRLSPADDANLAKYAAPGTPVDVIPAGQGS